MSESDLIDRLHNSDTEALRIIFERYHQQLFRFLLYRTGDEKEAEDLLQDVYVRLWEYRENVADINIRSYIYSIAASLSSNRTRKKKYELEFIHNERESFNKNVRENSTQESGENTQKMLSTLEQCINDLPEKQRTTLLLNRIEGLTYKEISAFLELSQKAIEKRMKKAYDLLRFCMENILRKK